MRIGKRELVKDFLDTGFRRYDVFSVRRAPQT